MPSPSELQDKVEKIKNDGVEYQTDEDRAIISGWEQSLKDIRASESFLEHPETVQLKALCDEKVAEINRKLQIDRKASEAQRFAWFELRDFADRLIQFLTRDPEIDAERLAQDIEDKQWDGEQKESDLI